MSNQNLVPRTDKSGSIGVPSKQWGSGSFATLDVEKLGVSNANLTGSLSGSFKGTGSGNFSGTFSGSASGSFQGEHTGNFTGDGSGLNNITALDTGSLLGIQRIYNSGSSVDDYTTISGALADSVNGDTVFVGAGVYNETDLIIPAGVQLTGKTATDRDVILTAQGLTTNEAVVKVLDDGQFAHFEVKGANDTNPVVILQGQNTFGKNPYLSDVAIRGGNNTNQAGLLVTGSGFTVAQNLTFITKGDVIGDSIIFEGIDGLTFFGRNIRYSAIGRSLFKTTGSAGIVELSGMEVEGTAVDYTYGIDIDSNVSLQLNNFNWSNDVSSSLYMNKNSMGADATFMAGNAEGSQDDVLIHPSASGVGTDIDFAGVQFRGERYNDQTLGTWSAEAKVHGLFIDEGQQDDPKVGIIGAFAVGSPDFPSETSFGEGNSSILNMRVFHSGSNGWVNQTADAQSDSGSAFTVFPDSGSGATWYIGSLQRKFSGIKSQMLQHQIDGEVAGVWEYSSGSEWVPFNILSTDANFPYNQYGQRVFPSESTAENNIRFNNLLVIEDPEAVQDVDWTKTTVNGTPGYWARYRLTSSLSQSAELERVKLHTSRTHIAEDGFNELFGAAEVRRDLVWHKNLEYTLTGKTPTPSTINISPNISLEYPENQLTNQAIDGNGGIVKIPNGLNTSREISLQLTYIPSINATDANRQIELEIDVVEIKTGDILDGTLTEKSYSNIIPISQTDGLKVKQTTFNFDIPNVTPGEFFAISYYRDATNNNADDNYTGDIRVTGVDIIGTFWQL